MKTIYLDKNKNLVSKEEAYWEVRHVYKEGKLEGEAWIRLKEENIA